MNLEDYEGQWVAIKNDEVIAHHKDPLEMTRVLNTLDDIKPVNVFRVPKKGEPEVNFIDL